MKQESTTKTPEKEGHLGGQTKADPQCLIDYQRDSKKGNAHHI